MFFNNKTIIIVCLVFLVFISMQSIFAIDNETVTVEDGGNELQKVDIYFNASAVSDGDGSKENPYNVFSSYRIVNNSNIYLSEGEYFLNTSYRYVDGVTIYSGDKTISSSLGYSYSLYGLTNVSFYGQGSDKTIIREFDDKIWFFNSNLSLNNITFVNYNININEGNLIVNDVIFKDSTAHYCDNYHNYQGGVISTNYESNIEIYNSQFINSSSEYGGAIYMNGGNLKIVNSSFIDTTSSLLGGAIYCQPYTNVNISKSKFRNCQALNSDGGAIYLFASLLEADDLNFTECSAGFGGAICSLNSTVSLNNSYFENNEADYSAGAIFAMYGLLNIANSQFINNSFNNASSVVVNAVDFNLSDNKFSGNGNEILAYSMILDINGNEGLNDENVLEVNTFSFNRISGDYSLFKFNLTEFTGELPEYYSLVDDGYVSSVKNQKNGGNCWSFTAMAVLESCILKLTNATYDFSEANLKNLMAWYSNWGWNSETNEGGKVGMVIGYLSSWLGPILDVNDRYSDRNVLSNVFDAMFHIDNVVLINRNNFTDNDAVKRAILTYGAVGGDLMYNEYFLNKNTSAYYCDDKYSTNHAVTIVGWNDTYSKDNFLITPEGDGAWIVKNSWSEDWGDKGYFYLSYYDKTQSVGPGSYLYTIMLNNTQHYYKNYQYDMGYTTVLTIYTDSISYKNIFNSTGEEYLAAVSTYFFSPVNFTASIYINDTFIMNKSASANAGYHTIGLDRLIKLNEGDLFTVQINQKTLDGSYVKLPFMGYEDFNKDVAREGISYLYFNGDWRDSYLNQSAVLCIKAFTVKGLDATIQINVTDTNITATVKDIYGNLLNEGKIIFKINDEATSVDIENGIASLDHDFRHLEYYEITATLNATGYNNVSEAKTIYHNLDINLAVENIVYGNAVVLNVTLNSDMALNNNVTVEIAGKTYSFSVSTQNITYAVPDIFDAGNYTANLFYIDHFNNIERNASFNITQAVNNINIMVSDVHYPNKAVIIVKADVDGVYTVKVNETSVNVTVNNGEGYSEVLLGVGDYTANLSWINDNYLVTINNDSFSVLKREITMTVTPVVDFNDVNITVEMSLAINDTVIVNVSGDIKNLNLTDGKGVLKLNDLPQGFYNVTVILDSDNYHVSDTNANFTIDKYISQVSVVVKNITVGEALYITVNVTSDYSQKPTGNVTIFIGTNNKTYNLVNGAVSLNASGFAYGDYNITALYSGDSLYSPKTANASFSVLKVKPAITVSNTTSYGSGIHMTIPKDLSGNLTATIRNTTYSVAYSGSDFYVIVPDLSIGSYELNISYGGDNKYLPLNISTTLQVSKVNPVISANSLSSNVILASSGISYAVTLRDSNNNPLTSKSISITFDGKPYTAVTNARGAANFKLYSTSSGNKAVVIRFNGDSTCNLISTTKYINVAKVKTSISAAKKTYKKSSKSKKLQATLKDSYGNVIKNAKVTFKVKSKKYTAKTNAKGVVTVKVKITKKGSYKVAVNFSGDNKYLSSSKSTTLKIK